MMKLHKIFLQVLIFVFFSLLLSVQPWAQSLIATECEPLRLSDEEDTPPVKYGQGVFWRLSRSGQNDSVILGTIHVSDERILQLPKAVSSALETSRTFVMEALPEQEQMAQFTAMMFYNDGTRLDHMISATMFNRTVEILKGYRIPEQSVIAMKPWAAYLTMNYPTDLGMVLDLALMQQARTNGAELAGLETLQEQAIIFSDLAHEDQIQLLIDAVCHHDMLSEEFEMMKELYLQRNLGALYNYGNRYTVAQEPLYKRLMDRLLTRRNYTMVDRMLKVLENGEVFVAIGALHLPGEEGVLNLLSQHGYAIKRIY